MSELAPGAVTTADLYRELVGLRTDMVRAIERIAVVDQARADHESRLRALEAFRWKLVGASLFFGALAGGAASWIALAIHH